MQEENKNDFSAFAPEDNDAGINKPQGANKKAKKCECKSGGGAWVILLLVLIVIAGLFFLDAKGEISLFGNDNLVGQPSSVSQPQADWQAVFLSNGQVYFGKLSKTNTAYPELTDIYYLQVQNVPIQPAEPANPTVEGVQPAVQTQQQMILVKFGTELHKPMDIMYLNKDHILFFEDLTPDSAVVTSINDYLKAEAEKAKGTQE